VWILILSGADKEKEKFDRVYEDLSDEYKEKYQSIQAALRTRWTPADHKWYQKVIKDAILRYIFSPLLSLLSLLSFPLFSGLLDRLP
jgi:hypothetical protein